MHTFSKMAWKSKCDHMARRPPCRPSFRIVRENGSDSQKPFRYLRAIFYPSFLLLFAFRASPNWPINLTCSFLECAFGARLNLNLCPADNISRDAVWIIQFEFSGWVLNLALSNVHCGSLSPSIVIKIRSSNHILFNTNGHNVIHLLIIICLIEYDLKSIFEWFNQQNNIFTKPIMDAIKRHVSDCINGSTDRRLSPIKY